MLKRWRLYQREEFPIVRNGILAAIFSSAAVCYSLLSRQGLTAQSLTAQTIGAAVIAFLVVFLFWLQLQIVNELRKPRGDRSRPVVEPRLISLAELSMVGIGAAAIQFGLTLSLGSIALLLELIALWGYLGLISHNFFISGWLKTHPLIDRLLYVAGLPLVALYATSCDWSVAEVAPPLGIIWFLLVSLLAALAIQLGQTVRFTYQVSLQRLNSPVERGKPTFLSNAGIPQLGLKRTVMLWLCLLWLLTLAALLAAVEIRFLGAIALISLLLLTAAVIVAWRFLLRPNNAWVGWFERLTVFWSGLVYLALGIVPLTLQNSGRF
jgi:hypothetical protein